MMPSIDPCVCKQHLSNCFLICFVGVLVNKFHQIFELIGVPAMPLISGLYEIHVNFKHRWKGQIRIS